MVEVRFSDVELTDDRDLVVCCKKLLRNSDGKGINEDVVKEKNGLYMISAGRYW